MGAWGPQLYQDDVAQEVRDYYKDQLHRGKTGPEITQELMEQYADFLSDPDDAPPFWFALADTQWNLGRLEESVRDEALRHIRDGYDLNRWEEAAPSLGRKRAKVLETLEEKLLSPQPPEKKISQYRLYRCEWNVGDVFAYQLNSEDARAAGVFGKYLYFVKAGEDTWWPGHIVPNVYFYKIVTDDLLPLEALRDVEYIPQAYYPSVYIRKPEMPVLYLLTLLNTSRRVIPKAHLHFLGNFPDLPRPDREDPNAFPRSWKDLEPYIIENFRRWEVLP